MTANPPTSPVLDPPVEPAEALDLDDVRPCIELLQRIVADRGALASVPLEMRQALLIAAGQAWAKRPRIANPARSRESDRPARPRSWWRPPSWAMPRRRHPAN